MRRFGGDLVQLTGLAGHPVNDGGICPRAIAEIQNLYHPNRLRAPIGAVDWDAAFERLRAEISGHRAIIGVGRVPIAERMLIDVLAGKIGATVVEVRSPSGDLPARGFGAFGMEAATFDLAQTDCVLSLGWDWLRTHPSPVEAQRAFASIRRRDPRGRMIAVSSRLSTTAAKSDRWIPVPAGGVATLAMSLAHALLRNGSALADRCASFAEIAAADRFAPDRAARELGIAQRAIEETASDLAAHARPVVVSGDGDLAASIAAVGLDVLLGAVGRPGGIVPPPRFSLLAFDPAPLRSAVFPADARGAVVLLFGANPVYSSAPESGWREGLAGARFVASIDAFADESASAADLVLPASTPLESPQLAWGATQGGVPFVAAGPAASAPLYDARSPIEILFSLARRLELALPWSDRAEYFDAVARALGGAELIDTGGFAGAPAEARTLEARALSEEARTVLGQVALPEIDPAFPLALEIAASAFVDGDGSHLPHLHGLSDPSGRETWRTMVELHPSAAFEVGVRDGDAVRVESAAGSIDAYARVREGIHPRSAAIALGLGRSGVGPWADGQGANPLGLLGPNEAMARVRVVRRT